MYIYRGVRLSFSKHIVFFCLKIVFTFTNSVDLGFTVCKTTRLGISRIKGLKLSSQFPSSVPDGSNKDSCTVVKVYRYKNKEKN